MCFFQWGRGLSVQLQAATSLHTLFCPLLWRFLCTQDPHHHPFFLFISFSSLSLFQFWHIKIGWRVSWFLFHSQEDLCLICLEAALSSRGGMKVMDCMESGWLGEQESELLWRSFSVLSPLQRPYPPWLAYPQKWLVWKYCTWCLSVKAKEVEGIVTKQKKIRSSRRRFLKDHTSCRQDHCGGRGVRRSLMKHQVCRLGKVTWSYSSSPIIFLLLMIEEGQK